MKLRLLTALTVCATAWSACVAPGVFAAVDDKAKGVEAYNNKDFRKALTLFSASAGTDPQSCLYCGMCYQQLGYQPQALEMFKRVCQSWGTTKEAQSALGFIHKSEPAYVMTAPPTPVDATAGLSDAEKKLFEEARKEWNRLPDKLRIPFTVENNAMVVRAKVNGREVRMPFDTGASLCCISLIDFPGIIPESMLAGARTMPVSMPEGMRTGWVVTTTVEVEGVCRKIPVLVFNIKNKSLIGENFFKPFSYEVDNAYIRLTKVPFPTLPGEKAAAASTVSGGAARAAKNDKFSIPFENSHNCMLIDIEINGHPVKAVFDTGCCVPGVVLGPALARNLDLRFHSDGTTIDRLIVGPIVKAGVKATFAPGLSTALIGPPLFGDHRYQVDQAEHCIKFAY